MLPIAVVQAEDDVQRQRFSAEPIEAKLKELREAGEGLKYIQTIRKLRAYGSLTFRLCTGDFPSPGSPLTVTVDLQKLTLRRCDADGTVLVR